MAYNRLINTIELTDTEKETIKELTTHYCSEGMQSDIDLYTVADVIECIKNFNGDMEAHFDSENTEIVQQIEAIAEKLISL